MATPATRCSAKASSGQPCKATALPGRDVCRWHDRSPEGRARHQAESRRGGEAKAYGSLTSISPLSDDAKVAALNLETAEGLRGFLSATLSALARMPFDVRVANAISSLATAQRNTIEASDFEARLSALEAAAQATPSRLRAG